jgi:hypothetical protein
MARLQDTFNFGDFENLDKDGLKRLLERMWHDLAVAINSKPDLYQRTTDGQVDDTFLAQGAININLNTNKVEMLTNHNTPSTVTWVTLG